MGSRFDDSSEVPRPDVAPPGSALHARRRLQGRLWFFGDRGRLVDRMEVLDLVLKAQNPEKGGVPGVAMTRKKEGVMSQKKRVTPCKGEAFRFPFLPTAGLPRTTTTQPPNRYQLFSPAIFTQLAGNRCPFLQPWIPKPAPESGHQWMTFEGPQTRPCDKLLLD